MTTANWNPLRLLETLNYFGEIPFVGNFRWVQQMLGADPNPQAPGKSALQPSKRLVVQAQEATIAQDLKNELHRLGLSLPIDLALPSTTLPSGALPERFSNIQAILWAGSHHDGAHLTALATTVKERTASESVPLFNFQAATTNALAQTWGAVDDVVMGGVSTSGLRLLPGCARFTGTVSTANSGGFASVRSRNFEPAFDLTDWQGVRLDVQGDGQRYKLILRNSANWDSLAYCASVDTEPNRWISIDVPFAALQPTFRARTQPTAPSLDASSICSFQLMLSKFEYDGAKNPHFQAGAFALDVRSIAAYRAVAPPMLIAIAPSATQAASYADHLRNSGISHQVLDRSNPDQFPQPLLERWPDLASPTSS